MEDKNQKNRILNKEEQEKEEMKYYNESLSGKVENQNQTHNSRKESMGPNTNR